MAKIAFLGLGVMGFPMAGHLATAGYEVCVYNRSPEKAMLWNEQYVQGRRADTPAEAALGADVVLACVGADADIESVCLGAEGAFDAMRPGALFVDHTTVSAKMARFLALEGQERGLLVIDAPVSGGQAGAEQGELSIMCGGSTEAFVQAKPYMSAYASRIVHIGDAGAGQLAKMANQIAIAGLVQALSEAIHFATAAEIDVPRVIEAISGGAAQSWQMDNRAQTMIDGVFDFGFAVDWMRKDLGLALDAAARNGARLPVTALVDQFYADVQAMDGGRQDTSALIRRLEGRLV